MYRENAEIQYCPECGWNTYGVLFPGNNGEVVVQCCTFCGWWERGSQHNDGVLSGL